ncbi:tumor necrosis factor receptor superfamily member 16 isoform X1 [Patella vulgata]|uniref:tumor necrosis factor receptor superfamily member 16 isoform X1 n=1 Tax=Patella vulgata TaxID=6465 RepID=UPI00217FA8D5|nr:tumor necrosis factor receptor superfamily member 16 isoform X1 [Patella vulgata]
MMRRVNIVDTMYWIIVLFVTANAITLATSDCEKHQVEVEGRCCSECSIGSGVASPCNAGNNTICEACIDGEYYSSTSSHTHSCIPCSKCPKNSRVIQECTNSSDTICECEPEFHLTENGECKLCDLCPAGWGASVPCSRTQNTVCNQCTNGAFSKVLSATSGCLVCSVCVPGAQMLQACSATEDTICISLPIYRYPTEEFTDTDNKQSVQNDHPKSNSKQIDIIPLYCAILGAVVVGLLGYVIMVHYRRMKEKRLIREPHDDVEYSKASAGDSGICVEVEHQQKVVPVVLTSSTRIRDLPSSKRREIERSFLQSTKDSRDWQGLARELGFNTKKIANCEIKSQRDSSTPLKHLLADWGRNDSATVGVFIQAMKNLGRHDVLPTLNVHDTAELCPLVPQNNIV